MQLDLFPAHPEITRLQAERTRFECVVLAKNTLTAYAYDWAMFRAFCNKCDRCPLPASADTVALYFTAMLGEGRKVVTCARRGCAIAYYHRASNLPSPLTGEVYGLLEAAQRVRAERPRQMRPLSVAQLRAISDALHRKGGSTAVRDRALLVVGFASALRRSNLAALMMEDLEFARQGFILEVKREKNDPQSRGRYIGIPRGKRRPTCPERCLRAWLKLRGIEPGPLFHRLDPKHEGEPMDGEAVERVVKRAVALIGLDPRDRWSAHSLRAGFITECALNGISELLIATTSGHKSMTVLRRYFRKTDIWQANASGMIGL